MQLSQHEFAMNHIKHMYHIASRQVSFDKILINKTAKRLSDRLIEFLKTLDLKKAIGDQLNNLGRIYEIVNIKNVKGENINLAIFILGKKYSFSTNKDDPKYLVYEADTENFVIRLFIDEDFKPSTYIENIGNLQPEIYSYLIHEITHNMDVLSEKVEYENYTVHRYVNDPSEVKAFLVQIISELEQKHSNLQTLSMEQKQYIIKNLINESDIYDKLYDDLNQKNKQYILEAVYNELVNPK